MLTIDQLKDRQKGIGGSDAAAICGKNPNKTPLSVYLDKITEIKEEDIKEPTEEQRWGNLLEPLVFKEYARRNDMLRMDVSNIGFGCETLKRNFVHIFAIEKQPHLCKIKNAFVSENNKFMRANLDGLIVELDKNEEVVLRGLEIKTKKADYRKEFGPPGSDYIPDSHLLQCAHYAACCDLKNVDIAVLISTNDFRQYTYERNKELEDKLIEREKYFWEEHVLKRIPPPPQTLTDLKILFPMSVRKDKKVNEEIYKELLEIIQIKERIKNEENALKTHEFKVKEFLEDNDTLLDFEDNIVATYKSSSRKSIDVDALKKRHQQIYEECLRNTNVRTLLIK